MPSAEAINSVNRIREHHSSAERVEFHKLDARSAENPVRELSNAVLLRKPFEF